MLFNAKYALVKQLNTLVLTSNYGEVELTTKEHQEVVAFLTELLERRIQKAEYIKKKWRGKR